VFEIWLGYNNWKVKWIDIIKSFVFLDDNKSEDEEDKEEVTANEAVVGSGGGGWPFCAEFEPRNILVTWYLLRKISRENVDEIFK